MQIVRVENENDRTKQKTLGNERKRVIRKTIRTKQTQTK